MDRFSQMQIFVAVAETQGFSAGARRMGVSASVATRAIATLEDRLHVKLFVRTTRHVRLTDAGENYLLHAKQLLDDLQLAEESVVSLNAKASGHLIITASVLFGNRFVMPVINNYLNLYPDTKVSALFFDRVINLAEEGVDVAVRIGNLDDSSLRAAPVGQIKHVICASPKYLKQNGRPLVPQDLSQHTTIAASRLDHNIEWKFANNQSVRVTPRLNVTTNSAAIDAAVAGQGVTRVMSYQVTDLINQGALEIVLADCERAPYPVHILHREGRYSSAKTRTFVDLIVAHLRSLDVLAYR